MPALSGALTGEFQLLDGRLAVPWRATALTGADGWTHFAFTADPPEGALRAALELSPGGERGTWRIEEARLDAAAVFRQLGPILPPDLPEFSVTGTWEITGHGDWRDGGPLGPLHLAWHAPNITGESPELSVEDVSLAFTFGPGWAGGDWQGDGTLSAARATVSGVVLEQVDVVYSVLNDASIRLAGLRANAFGGTIDVAPFVWSATATEVAFGLEFDGLDLDLLAAAMPDMIRQARGEVHGSARFRWREDGGLEALGGELREIETDIVQVTFAPRPGFLTSNLPRRIQILPDWLGRVSREWLAPENPAYVTLERIEMGREPLVVDQFVLQFFPPDDPLGRTVAIRIEGRPREDPLLEKVVLTINLSGPLTDLLRLAIENSLEFDVTE